MIRIRFHGRGGHGVKTAGRIVGTAAFLAGYHVQDSPVYGAERRGTAVMAFARINDSPILERGTIDSPDLIVIADETLLNDRGTAVLAGQASASAVFVNAASSGGLTTLRLMHKVLGENVVVVNAAGCMTLLATYPFTLLRSTWLYTTMASAAAGAQGVRDALHLLKAKGQLSAEDDLKVLVLAGDGSTYDVGQGKRVKTPDGCVS